jgi:hypothetical protein|tara:strand:- start:1505 stop:1687 length:183 start_codon:yes stop_codon:yes gene_type:complete
MELIKGWMSWVKARVSERTSWDGAILVVLGVLVIFMNPLAKLLAWVALLWGAWTIYKEEL